MQQIYCLVESTTMLGDAMALREINSKSVNHGNAMIGLMIRNLKCQGSSLTIHVLHLY